MIRPRCRNAWFLLAVALTLGCEGRRPTAPSTEGPAAAIRDGAHGGNDHFYFLPPVVKAPAYTGIFDATARPTVEICRLTTTSTCAPGPLVAAYSMTGGSGGEVVSVHVADEHFQVKWRTADFALDNGGIYRVNVKRGAATLGFADVQIFTTSQQARNVVDGQTIALLDGHILNLKFRIEVGSGVTIDATRLSAPTVEVMNVRVFPSADIQSIDPGPGNYLLRYHTGALVGLGEVAFSISADNTLDYSSAVDAILAGRGTSTLTVIGSTVTINATALTAPTIDMPGASNANFSTNQVHTLTLLPGGHLIRYHTGALAGLGSVEYQVLNDGTLTYSAARDGVLEGRGSRALVIAGVTVTVDATPLTAPAVDMPGVSAGMFDTRAVHTLTLLPGGHLIRYHTAALSGLGSVEYFVRNDRTLDYESSLDGVLAGRGGTALRVTGVVIGLDATPLSAPRITMPGVSTEELATSTPHTLTLLPGGHLIRYLTSAASALAQAEYHVFANGTLSYAPSLEGALTGSGTANLFVPGVALSIDATALSGPTYDLGGIGTFSTSAVHTFRLLPGGHRATNVERLFEFLMTDGGAVTYDATLYPFLTGAGTAGLTVR